MLNESEREQQGIDDALRDSAGSWHCEPGWCGRVPKASTIKAFRQRFDWNASSRLYERGMIGDPVNEVKFAMLNDERLSDFVRFVKQHFVFS
ncbi:hypothetical protein DR64_7439 [Paraburkholderia xenovorans LB400]|uniref:Uncharacterized protein n=1 Tax=Paraburkholderia xenovorans (strain LB400) TaxID=266265 RepID=Q13GA3_PARXL|nr:hypothetical protein [Paraburkholderia xenovorans]ABE36886.1 hypothetical protein Bxe_C1013 [Paraburkholderia xenovorans LB400]AIP34912.1 hypothetical protein DR64_7439 [Paraburkholderia xenovorans LB400]